GKNGVSADKREGDGMTPIGTFPLRRLLYRPDHFRPGEIATGLPAQPLRADDGWCENPAYPEYNRPIRHPHPCTRDRMWRPDHLYDLIVIGGYNDAPVAPGRGSAIFLHLS